MATLNAEGEKQASKTQKVGRDARDRSKKLGQRCLWQNMANGAFDDAWKKQIDGAPGNVALSNA